MRITIESMEDYNYTIDLVGLYQAALTKFETIISANKLCPVEEARVLAEELDRVERIEHQKEQQRIQELKNKKEQIALENEKREEMYNRMRGQLIDDGYGYVPPAINYRSYNIKKSIKYHAKLDELYECAKR